MAQSIPPPHPATTHPQCPLKIHFGLGSQTLQRKLLVPCRKSTLYVLSSRSPHPRGVNTRGKSIWSLEGLHKEHAFKNICVLDAICEPQLSRAADLGTRSPSVFSH